MFGISQLRDKGVEFLSGAHETLYKLILVLLTVTALLWMSVFLYASFYYSYIPPVSHTRPVHLQFSRSCDRSSRAMCDFPSANVALTRREHFLMVGQPYKILLELEMPESTANQNLGMFMVCTRLQSKGGELVEESCRSALLQYKSILLHFISTLVLYPFLFSGSYEEKQVLAIELFSNFQEDMNNPVTDAFVELQSYGVEVYRASLKIHAHFTGLRHLMFHWPLTSAVLGISTNLFFLSVVAFLSWYKFFHPHQVTVHVGYDASKARTLEPRLAHSTERLSNNKMKRILAPPPAMGEPMKAKKEDLEFPSDGSGDMEPSMLENLLEEEEEQVVPESRGDSSRSSADDSESYSGRSAHSSNEFEVVGDVENGNEEMPFALGNIAQGDGEGDRDRDSSRLRRHK